MDKCPFASPPPAAIVMLWLFAIKTFLWGMGLSFLGSFSPGIFVLRIMEMSLRHSRVVLLLYAFGGALAEVIYTALLLHLALVVVYDPSLFAYAYFFVALLFVGLAMQTALRPKTNTDKSLPRPERSMRMPFQMGFLLGLGNFLPLPFWMAVTLELQERKLLYLGSPVLMWTYLIGIGLGTWLFLYAVVRLSPRLSAFFGAAAKRPSAIRWLKALRLYPLLYGGLVVYFLYRGIRLL